MRGPPPDYDRRGWGGPRGRMGPPPMMDGRGPYGGPPGGPMGPPFRGGFGPPMGMGKQATQQQLWCKLFVAQLTVYSAR